MTPVAALQQAQRELETTYRKDMEAIRYLLARLGASASMESGPTGIRVAARNPRIPHAPTKPGSLRDWAERAFAAHAGSELTAPLIVDWADTREANFQTARDKTIASFGNALRGLLADGIIELTIPGSGRRAAHYRWIGQQNSAEPVHDASDEINFDQQQEPAGAGS